MGEAAEIPIEPDEQTRLIDETIKIPGVVCSGVPGAGGFDALFAIVIDIPSLSFSLPLENVNQLWLTWKEISVLPQLVREDHHSILIEKLVS